MNNVTSKFGKGEKAKRLFFWEKWALKPENDKDDTLTSFDIIDDPSIREVIRAFESRIIGKKLPFSEVSPKNPSIKKWINKIRKSYPNCDNEMVEYLLDTFRDSLYARSKEKFKLIVGLIVLNDTILLINCKKDPSLAELKEKIYPVKLILHPKNVLRVAIIKDEAGKTTFSAFEYNKKWSKGHAEFWNIDPEDVSWETLGNIVLIIQPKTFPHQIQLPVESDQLDELIESKDLSPTGKIKMGREEGTVERVEIWRNLMDFSEFYDFWITQKEQLEQHRKKFRELIPITNTLYSFDMDLDEKYHYEEDLVKVMELTTTGKKTVYDKKHPRYTVCFFCKCYPRIKPSEFLINCLYQSVFNGKKMEIWHAAEETSQIPTPIGSLDIFNKIDVSRDFNRLSDNLLNTIQDASSKKTRLLLQEYYCELWKRNISNKHITNMFDYMEKHIIYPEIEYEFKNEGVMDKEEFLEFKSASVVDAKPTRFVNGTLVPTIKKYVTKRGLSRYCLLFGIEDNLKIKPLYHLKNDQVSEIEKKTNEELKELNISIKAFPIPYKDGLILAILIIP